MLQGFKTIVVTGVHSCWNTIISTLGYSYKMVAPAERQAVSNLLHIQICSFYDLVFVYVPDSNPGITHHSFDRYFEVSQIGHHIDGHFLGKNMASNLATSTVAVARFEARFLPRKRSPLWCLMCDTWNRLLNE